MKIPVASVGITALLSALAPASLFFSTSSIAQEAQSRALEEIVVTAQRREQSLQDAAVAIDVTSGEELLLRGITNANELSQINPALTVTDGGGIAGQVYMRGVGNKANNDYLDPAITVNYDGVPMARGSAVSTGAFFDLERVEVLKGPQGTLYGRNATGGVINIIPVKPIIGETSGYIGGSVGNFSDVQAEGAFNLPVGDSSAFRIAGSLVNHDGYNNDGTNDAERWNVRGQFLTDISDEFSIRVGVDYSDVGGVGPGTTPTGSYARTGVASFAFIPSGLPDEEGTDTAAGNAYRQTILSAPGFGFLTPIQDDWFVDASYFGINAEVNYETNFGTFTFIPAWRETEQESMFNGPGFNSGWWNGTVEQTSFEFRLADQTDGLVDYVAGLYLFDESMDGNNTFNQEFVLPLQNYTHETESWAVFGELTWKLGDSMRLVTGARYTDDHKEINGEINNYITFCGAIGPGLITPPDSFAQGCAVPGNLPHWPTFDTPEQTDQWLVDNGWASAFIPIPPGFLIPLDNGVAQILHAVSPNVDELDNEEPTWRLALEMDVFDDSMFYVSYEHGYRAGGLEPQVGAAYDPEFLDAYTVGIKNRLFDNSLQLNVEVFYWDYKDQQISYFNLNPQGVLQSDTQNVGASTNQGFDIDLLWAAGDYTTVSARVQYLDATYDDLHFFTTIPRDNINCPFTITGVTPEGDPALDFDCSGNQSIYSPEWSVQFGLQHTFALGWADLTASLFTQWLDDQVTGFQNLPHEVIDSHTRTDVDLTLSSVDGIWSVSAYARNLEDDRHSQSSQTPLLGMAMNQFGPPMLYGIRAMFNF